MKQKNTVKRVKFKVRYLIWIALTLVLALIIGTFSHEVLGHGAMTLLIGGQIDKACVLGVSVYPTFASCSDSCGFFGCLYPKNIPEDITYLQYTLFLILPEMFHFILSFIFIFVFINASLFSGVSWYFKFGLSIFFIDALNAVKSSFFSLNDFSYIDKYGVSTLFLRIAIIIASLIFITTIFLKFYLNDKKFVKAKKYLVWVLIIAASLVLLSLMYLLIKIYLFDLQ